MQGPVESRPLITFMIVAYNQEPYIGEAIAGALSQTYTPLEIILSDDCSGDRTFEIMEEMTRSYRGEQRIRLNRNERNLGFGAHIDYLMEMARGELIVVAAGDDVSLPERAERTWRTYAESGGRAMSVYSSLVMIDESGARRQTVGKPPGRAADDIDAYLKAGNVHGCSHAWHRRVFDIFGPMLPGTVYEDRVIPFRSLLLGQISYIDEPLVLYRRHPQNTTNSPSGALSAADVTAHVIKRQTRRLVTLKNHERDLQCDHEMVRQPADVRNRLAASLRRRIRELELEIEFNAGTFSDRVGVIRKSARAHLGLFRLAKWCVQLAYPYPIIRARKKLSADLDRC